MSDLKQKIKSIEKYNLELAENYSSVEVYASSLVEVRDVAKSVFQKATGTNMQIWGSWVPDIALAHSLIRYPLTIFDLAPVTVSELEKAVEIKIEQFIELIIRGFIKVNLIHYDYKNEETIEKYLKEDSVLTALLRNDKVIVAKGIYINSILRDPVFSHLAGSNVDLRVLKDKAATRFNNVTKKFGKLCENNTNLPATWQKAIFRGAPPHPNKIAYNYAYLQCAEQYLDVKNDTVLQAIFADGVDDALNDPYRFAVFAERLEVCHKLVTAPLTGASAGTYGMSIIDSDKLIQILDEQRFGIDRWKDTDFILENNLRRTWFELLKDIACGKLDRFAANIGVGPGKTSRIGFRQPLSRMNEYEFKTFLDFLELNVEILELSEQVISELEKLFFGKNKISETDLIDFLRALDIEFQQQEKLLKEKFQKLIEPAMGIVEATTQFEFIGLSSKAVKILSRSDDYLLEQADKEAVNNMREVIKKCDEQPRLILDIQNKWSI